MDDRESLVGSGEPTGEFLKGFGVKVGGFGGVMAGYSRDGDSRGLARACDETRTMTKRGSAVLDTPEQRYVSGMGGPRRAAAGLRRDLQDDYGHDFEDDFGMGTGPGVEPEFGSDPGSDSGMGPKAGRRGEGARLKRRSAGRGGVRRYGYWGGCRRRFGGELAWALGWLWCWECLWAELWRCGVLCCMMSGS